MESKSRSPRYAMVSLRDALERVKSVYQKEHRHKADKEVIAKDLGYAGLNGASLGMIAALKHYNLIENAGDGLRVSDDAVTILELPFGDSERSEAINRVAFAPKLFAELSEMYGLKLPSDENLRLVLIRRGFGDKAASSIVRTYRETISLVQEEVQDYNDGSIEARQSQEQVKSMQPVAGTTKAELNRILASRTASDLYSLGVPMPTQGAFTEDLHYRISEDCKVRVMFEGTVTKEAIKKLVAYLELGADDFPSKAQLQQQTQSGEQE